MPESGIPSELIEEDEICDYAFVGDINEVHIFILLLFIPTHSPHHKMILTENANIYRNPYIIASGITQECDPTNFTFTLTPSQYINLAHTVLDCPISCFIDSESKRWKSKKPMPTTGTNISLSGTLTKIKRDINRKPTFELELDNIAYLAHQSGSSTNISNRTFHITSLNQTFLKQSQGTSSSIPTSHTRFNYDSILPSSESSIPTMPSPVALGKRKQSDDETSEHDEKRSHTADD